MRWRAQGTRHVQDPAYDQETRNALRPRRLKPTVSPATDSLAYFISIGCIDHPVWGIHREEAKRGQPSGHRITRHEGAMMSLLLPYAPTGCPSSLGGV